MRFDTSLLLSFSSRLVCYCMCYFFFNVTATTKIYTYCTTLPQHDALPIWWRIIGGNQAFQDGLYDLPNMHRPIVFAIKTIGKRRNRSEEHTSELQPLMRISYSVFCLQKKNKEYIYTTKVLSHITNLLYLLSTIETHPTVKLLKMSFH